MRRRLVVGTVAVIIAVLTALVPPVVILLRRAAERELQVRLSSEASDVSVAIADDIFAGESPTVEQIASLVSASDLLVVLDSAGQEIVRYGPAVSDPVTGRADGPAGTEVRVAASGSELTRRVRGPLLALGAFAVGSVLLGAVLAGIVARRLTRPLDDLARSADRLGAGDFSAAVPDPSGIREIDGIGAALSSSAARLDRMLAAERSFTGDATHQLRTGLAGIGLRLDLLAAADDAAVREDAAEARAQVDRLTATLDELLALARTGSGRERADVDVGALVAAHCRDWRVRAERVRRTVEVTGVSPTWQATPGLVGQIVDVLLDNALRHGRGTVRVTVAERSLAVADGGAIAPDVAASLFDASPRADVHAVHGRGLALARRLARADGGSLELTSADPTTFTLAYPTRPR